MNLTKYFALCLLCSGNSLVPFAQPAPAKPQKGTMAISGADIHTGNGNYIPSGIIVFENGKISYVGQDRSRLQGVDSVLDVPGLHAYPGFIAMASNLGLAEIEQVRATLDFRELGNYNPNIRSFTSFNTDSKVLPTVRSNGVLLAQVAPQGGVIPGQSSVFQLDAWNWEDAVLSADEGLFVNWPNPSVSRRQKSQEADPENQYLQAVRALYEYFDHAKAYALLPGNPAEVHLGHEALRKLWTREKTLYIQANPAKALVHAIQFAQHYKLRLVLVGASDASHILPLLKESKTPIVLSQPHRLPSRTDEAVDLPFATPSILLKTGIPFCLSMNGFWEQRNLPFQAGHCMAFGLDYESAVSSISLQAARILGIDDRCGSIETGKDATFFLSKGDALDMKTHEVTHAFIQGRSIDLDNKHKELYRRFRAKY